jgi:hypothetical protein
VAATAQPDDRERPIVVLVDGVQNDALASALLTLVWSEQDAGQDCTPDRDRGTDDGAGPVPGGFVAPLEERRLIALDPVGMAGLPGLDVDVVAVGVGTLPGRGSLLLAVLTRRLATRGRGRVTVEVVERPGLAAGAATFSYNQLFCS